MSSPPTPPANTAGAAHDRAAVTPPAAGDLADLGYGQVRGAAGRRAGSAWAWWTPGRTAAAQGLVAAAAAALVVARDPHVDGSFATCPVLAFTGLYCPGCGSLRAMHDLATGHPVEALGHNVLALVALVWLVWWWVARAASVYTTTRQAQRIDPAVAAAASARHRRARRSVLRPGPPRGGPVGARWGGKMTATLLGGPPDTARFCVALLVLIAAWSVLRNIPGSPLAP